MKLKIPPKNQYNNLNNNQDNEFQQVLILNGLLTYLFGFKIEKIKEFFIRNLLETPKKPKHQKKPKRTLYKNKRM